jgi:hypothetical protein
VGGKKIVEKLFSPNQHVIHKSHMRPKIASKLFFSLKKLKIYFCIYHFLLLCSPKLCNPDDGFMLLPSFPLIVDARDLHMHEVLRNGTKPLSTCERERKEKTACACINAEISRLRNEREEKREIGKPHRIFAIFHINPLASPFEFIQFRPQ